MPAKVERLAASLTTTVGASKGAAAMAAVGWKWVSWASGRAEFVGGVGKRHLLEQATAAGEMVVGGSQAKARDSLCPLTGFAWEGAGEGGKRSPSRQ